MASAASEAAPENGAAAEAGPIFKGLSFWVSYRIRMRKTILGNIKAGRDCPRAKLVSF